MKHKRTAVRQVVCNLMRHRRGRSARDVQPRISLISSEHEDVNSLVVGLRTDGILGRDRARLPMNLLRAYTGLVTVFFFFQAEDGIRDLIVTGVQTCALPI